MNPKQVTDRMLQLGSTQEVQETEFINHYMVDDEFELPFYEHRTTLPLVNGTFVLNTGLEY